ncbi:hypothetical protein GCM10020000_14020 [Streptomyces olivoverticillatus]
MVDAPPKQLVEPLKTFVGTLDSPDSDAAAFTALYYPWVKVPGVDGVPRTVPPSGHLAGVWARTDAERGVFKAPANQNLRGVLDLPTLLTDDQNGELNDKGGQLPAGLPRPGSVGVGCAYALQQSGLAISQCASAGVVPVGFHPPVLDLGCFRAQRRPPVGRPPALGHQLPDRSVAPRCAARPHSR